ncbi:MAG: hypothetical protein ACJ8AK_16625 [Gemmatimonadaceae bacterium]
MLAGVRRPTATLCLVLLAADVSGCHRVTKQSPDIVAASGKGIAPNEHMSGVTLNDGTEYKFDKSPAAFVRGDTIHANVGKQPLGFALSNVQRVWVESLDKGRTSLMVLGVTVGVLGTLVAIAIASKESCPFVYSWDGTQYVFDGEPYGGAITRGLERDDYSNLEQLRPDEAGNYRLMVTNEVNETQYTNSMELMVIDHQPGARIAMDEFGKPYVVSDARGPSVARDQDNRDLTAWLATDDQRIWEPLPVVNPTTGPRQEIVLEYPKPRGATRARLVARAGTGIWGSHMIREMLQLRGSSVTEWYASLDNSPANLAALRAWNVNEELYVLKLDVDEDGVWSTRGLLPGGGPFLTETRVVPLDVSRVNGDKLRLRIRPPSGFWALNSFEISYDDATPPLTVTRVAPMSAVTSDNRDVLADLTAADQRYYAMPVTGDRALLTFAAPPARPGTERSVFLHTRGYYRLHLPESGPANEAALARIVSEHDGAARLAAESFAKRRVAGVPTGGN